MGKNWFENEGGGGESILCVESEGKSLSNKQVYETGDHSPDTPLDSSPNLTSIYPPIIPPLSSSPAPSSSLPSAPSPKETVLSVLSSFSFGEELEETVRDWLEYKREKRQNYKAVGLKTLLGQIKRYAERYGDDAMIELIRDSMASNYQGITFDRLKRAPVRSGDRLKVAAMPGQGVTSMFNFGANFGWIQGVLEALRFPYELIAPQRWKKEFSLTSDKKASIRTAQRLFPGVSLLADKHCRVESDGVAEALLLAEYARRKLSGEEA